MGLKELKRNKRISLGDKLRRRRLSFGYKSQEDFAHIIGSNRVTVSRWESGRTGVGEEFREAIKKALKVDDSFFDQPATPTLSDLAAKAYADISTKPLNDPELEELRLMNRVLVEKVAALQSAKTLTFYFVFGLKIYRQTEDTTPKTD
jgi:transcriptional regulator with XRE-family HTH domain